jgi:Effector-associated domain 11
LADFALPKGVRSELLAFIADGQIEKAFDALANNKDIVLMKARYESLTLENNSGVLNMDDYRRELAKITKSLIDYLSSSRKEGFGKGHRGLFLGEQ